MSKCLVLVCCFLSLLTCVALGNVVLIGNNVTLSFEDIEASFAPAVKGSGECGTLYLAEPLDACSPLRKVDSTVKGTCSPFVLIVRGACSFEDKVRKALSFLARRNSKNPQITLGERASKNLRHGSCCFDPENPNVDGAWAQEATSKNALVIDSVKLATEFLAATGTFVTKVFRSQDYSAVLCCLRQLF